MFSTPEFWVLAAFVAFFVLLGKKLVVLIGGALDGRAAQIKAQLDEAERLRKDAEAALAEYKRKHADAIKEAEGLLALARSEAQALEAAALFPIARWFDPDRQAVRDKTERIEKRTLAGTVFSDHHREGRQNSCFLIP